LIGERPEFPDGKQCDSPQSLRSRQPLRLNGQLLINKKLKSGGERSFILAAV
jgi:hypothetical protein